MTHELSRIKVVFATVGVAVSLQYRATQGGWEGRGLLYEKCQHKYHDGRSRANCVSQLLVAYQLPDLKCLLGGKCH